MYECIDPLGCLEITPDSPIVIATILATEGNYAAIGIDSQRGVELAIEDKRGILGHPIELIKRATDCTTERAQLAATQLATNPDLAAVIGPTCSEETTVAAPALTDAGLLLISPSAVETTTSAGFFRTIYSPTRSGNLAAEFVYRSLGIRQAAILQDNSLDSTQRATALAIRFAELGGTTGGEATFLTIGTDLTTSLNTIASNPPEAVYLSLPPDTASLVMAQIRSMPGLENIPIVGSETLFTPDFLRTAGENARDIYLTCPDLAAFDNSYLGFLARYEYKYRQRPISPYHAYAYDAAMLLFHTIEQTAFHDRDGTLHIPSLTLRQVFLDVQNFPGLTGNLNCDESGNCANSRSTLAIYQIVNPDPAGWNPGINPKRIYP